MGRPLVPLTDAQQALAAQWVRLAWKEAIRAQKVHGIGIDSQDDGIGIAMLALTIAASRFEPERGFEFSTFATVSIRNAFRNEIQYRQCKCRCAGVHGLYDDKGEPMEIAEPVRGEEPNPRLLDLRAAVKRLGGREAVIMQHRLQGETFSRIGERLGMTKQRVQQLERIAVARLGCMLGRPQLMPAALRLNRRKKRNHPPCRECGKPYRHPSVPRRTNRPTCSACGRIMAQTG